jgi:hypothetical protein
MTTKRKGAKETKKGWKKGFKIVTLCTDGKRRSMVCSPDRLGGPFPIYEPEVEILRHPELEPFMVFKTEAAVRAYANKWPYPCEVWECAYLPFISPQGDEAGPGQDNADGVRLVRKIAESTAYAEELREPLQDCGAEGTLIG